jgi:RimJ/RimL family protein N-acetyltransferase
VNSLAAATQRFGALYDSDARGRLVRRANTDAEESETPPRFHLVRTALGNVWRFRADSSEGLVKRLATLAAKEAALPEPTAENEPAPPEREEFIRRALAAESPIVERWAGPAYGFPEANISIEFSGELRGFSKMDRALLHPELSASLLGQTTRGVVVDGEIVSLCTSVRGDDRGPAEAGVRTADGFEGRGYATVAVAAWAAAVRGQGGEPFYSTSWDNSASRAVARRLRLVFVGEERHWR